MSNWLTSDLLNELGFIIESDDGVYGKAIDKRTNGMTVLNWNREGHSCTYFGDKLTDNIALGIKKDGGTRIVFSGYVHNKNDLIKILNLTW